MSGSRLYVVMRNDLPSLNPGKAMAQACHAGSQAAMALASNKDYKQWAKQASGFGTTIVLGTFDEGLTVLVNDCNGAGIITGIIEDPTYPFKMDREIYKFIDRAKEREYDLVCTAINKDIMYMTRKETTCVWAFVTEDQLPTWESLTMGIALHP